MIAKTVLVLFMLVGRSTIEIQGTSNFPTEEACEKEADKINSKNTGWLSYPVKKASCTFDLTKK